MILTAERNVSLAGAIRTNQYTQDYRDCSVTTSSFLLGAALLGLAADWDVLYAADPAPGGFERAEQ